MHKTFIQSSTLLQNKYQPKLFVDYGDLHHIHILKTLTECNELNVLLYGNYCTGKTSTLKTIVREYYKGYDPTQYNNNVLYINTIKDQGINYYRNDVKIFCQTACSIINKKKTIVFDDLDFINESSQQVFRNCLDKYSDNINFIASATNIHKIIENLQSGMFVIQLPSISDKTITDIFNKIVLNENLTFSREVTDFIISISNTNIKNLINNIEKIKLYNKQDVSLTDVMNLCCNINYMAFEKYTQYILNHDLPNSIKLLLELYDKGYSVLDILDSYFNFIKVTSNLTEPQKYTVIKLLCKYITIFYNIHEDEIELALFSNNMVQLF